MKYIKKQQPLEAIQWTGDIKQLVKFGILYADFDELNRVILSNPFGHFCVDIGDYITRHENGYNHPCSRELFESMYQRFE